MKQSLGNKPIVTMSNNLAPSSTDTQNSGADSDLKPLIKG